LKIKRIVQKVGILKSLCYDARSEKHQLRLNVKHLGAELTCSVELAPMCSTVCKASNGKWNSYFRVNGASVSFSHTCLIDWWFSFEVKLPVMITSCYKGIKCIITEYWRLSCRRTVTDIERDLNKTYSVRITYCRGTFV